MHCSLDEYQTADKYVDADDCAKGWVNSGCCAYWLYLSDSIRFSGLHVHTLRPHAVYFNLIVSKHLCFHRYFQPAKRRKDWCKSPLFSESLLSWFLSVLLFVAVVFVTSRMLFVNFHPRAFIAPDTSQAIKFVNADSAMISAWLCGQVFMALSTSGFSRVRSKFKSQWCHCCH